MTNQFLHENCTQATDRNRENSARVVLRSLYSRGFHLFIPVCFWSQNRSSSPSVAWNWSLPTHDKCRRGFSIPKCISYLAKYLNRIFHGLLIIAVVFRPAATTRILIPPVRAWSSFIFPCAYICQDSWCYLRFLPVSHSSVASSNFLPRQRERGTPRDGRGTGWGSWRLGQQGTKEGGSDRRERGRMEGEGCL